ncbi:MAG TPA: hypothetical protein VIT43_00485 [Candidatus Dormibacteraeota bacterium]
MCDLEFGHRNLLEVDGAIEQVVEISGRKDEFDPANAAERIEPPNVLKEGLQMLLVISLCGRHAKLREIDLVLERLGLGRHRREIRITLRQLGLKPNQRLADLALLALERRQLLLEAGLFLLKLRQPVRERAWIIRVGRHGGQEEQQGHEGRCRADYSGGAPAEPGMPGSRRGLKVVTPPNGGVTPFGFFSFFFFLASRFPRSRDFAMVPASLT